jgi:hypothetical protein
LHTCWIAGSALPITHFRSRLRRIAGQLLIASSSESGQAPRRRCAYRLGHTRP